VYILAEARDRCGAYRAAFPDAEVLYAAALPGGVRPGDLLAVPAAGAYQLSMASGYHMVGRPPVVAVRDGAARVLVRRESLDDVSRRDGGR
jgi:diaminopimelate decarboxylase